MFWSAKTWLKSGVECLEPFSKGIWSDAARAIASFQEIDERNFQNISFKHTSDPLYFRFELV